MTTKKTAKKKTAKKKTAKKTIELVVPFESKEDRAEVEQFIAANALPGELNGDTLARLLPTLTKAAKGRK